MKIYAISIGAAQPFEWKEGEPTGFVWEHKPGLQPADTMDEAAAFAEKQAFEHWPIDQGWRDHNAVMMVVTEPFCEAAGSALRAGILNMDQEEQRVFAFPLSRQN